jgi:uroporphyrinogen decarboxylase
MTLKPLLQAAQGQRPKHTPQWLMRQAGRYLPEYRALRVQHDTLTMFKTPRIASEITLQPLRRFPTLDAAIVYADILLIPDALGLGLQFVQGEGPVFSRPIRSESDVQWLEEQASNPAAIMAKLDYLNETLQMVKGQLAPEVTLIGFAGAPWTVASYMLEGQSAHGEFFTSKLFMLQHPSLFERVMKVVTDLTITYLERQVKSGAEIIQLFESWGGALTPAQYSRFCLPFSKKIIETLKTKVPVIHFVGESAGILPEVLSADSDVLGVDWRQDIARVAQHARGKVKALQGNLDPLLLHASQRELQSALEKILASGNDASDLGYIFNLGHGIRQTTPVENVAFVTDFVRKYAR